MKKIKKINKKSYNENEIYELDDKQIADLRAQGYQVDIEGELPKFQVGGLQYDTPDPNATYRMPASYEEYSTLVNKEKTKKVKTVADRNKLQKQISDYNITGEITTDSNGQQFQKQQKLIKDENGNLVIDEYLIKVDNSKPTNFNNSGNSPIHRALAYPSVYVSERTGTTNYFKGDPAYDAASKQGLGASLMDGMSLMSPYAWDYALGQVGTNNQQGQKSYSMGDEFMTDLALSGPGMLTANLAKTGLKKGLPYATKSFKQAPNFAKKTLRESVDTFHPVGKKLKAIEKKGLEDGLSELEIKKLQMNEVGITSKQREGYLPGVSELVSEYITPYSYDNPLARVLSIPPNIITGNKNSKKAIDLHTLLEEATDTADLDKMISKPRYDAWRMYSGLPQKHNTFRLSETSPLNHPSYSKSQLDNLEKFSINDENNLLSDLPNEFSGLRYQFLDNETLIHSIPEIEKKLKNIDELKKNPINISNDFEETNIMGGYNRRFFDNKMEYNDIWDLDLKGTKVDKYFGKPFLSHGQLEYSLQDVEAPFKSALERAKKLEQTTIHNKKYKNVYENNDLNLNSLYIKPSSYKDIEIDYLNKPITLNRYKKGGSIEDDRGYWNPENRNKKSIKINSNKITMKDEPGTGNKVPFPILGISNTGHKQMMYPGQDYQFDGDSVTEYPIMNNELYQAIMGGIIGHQINPTQLPEMQDGGQPTYNDSLILYEAYQFQKNNMPKSYESTMSDYAKTMTDFGKPTTIDEIKAIRNKNLGPPGTTFPNDKSNHFYKSLSYDPADNNEKNIINYYKKLTQGNSDFRIGDHSSPDLWHKNINPVGSYFDGVGMNPIYHKPGTPFKSIEKSTSNMSTDWGAVLREEGKDGSYKARKQMYIDMGMEAEYGAYKGSAEQNIAALNMYKNPQPFTPTDAPVTQNNQLKNTTVNQETVEPKKEYSRYVNIHGVNHGFNTKEEFYEIAARKNLVKNGWADANVPKNMKKGGSYLPKAQVGEAISGLSSIGFEGFGSLVNGLDLSSINGGRGVPSNIPMLKDMIQPTTSGYPNVDYNNIQVPGMDQVIGDWQRDDEQGKKVAEWQNLNNKNPMDMNSFKNYSSENSPVNNKSSNTGQILQGVNMGLNALATMYDNTRNYNNMMDITRSQSYDINPQYRNKYLRYGANVGGDTFMAQDGGLVEERELTDKEIDDLRSQGYQVDILV